MLYWTASLQSRSTSVLVASALRSVWSIIAARCLQCACAGAAANRGASEISIAIRKNSNSFVAQRVGRNYADIRKVAVALGVIESVTHDEPVRNRKTNVIALYFLDTASRLVEQSSDF